MKLFGENKIAAKVYDVHFENNLCELINQDVMPIDEIKKYLKDNECKIGDSGKARALKIAAELGKIGIVRLLLENPNRHQFAAMHNNAALKAAKSRVIKDELRREWCVFKLDYDEREKARRISEPEPVPVLNKFNKHKLDSGTISYRVQQRACKQRKLRNQ